MAIKPTPSIAVVGSVDNVENTARALFGREGLEVALLGEMEAEGGASLAGSIRVAMDADRCQGRPPAVDYERERAVQGACRTLVKARLVEAAHDLSEGGLAVALAEMCLGGPGWPQVGVYVQASPAKRLDQLLFGEDPGRILIAYPSTHSHEVSVLTAEHRCPITVLGRTGGSRLSITTPEGHELLNVSLADLHARWSQGFADAISR